MRGKLIHNRLGVKSETAREENETESYVVAVSTQNYFIKLLTLSSYNQSVWKELKVYLYSHEIK